MNITDWTLPCGAFRADIRQTQGWGCQLTINGHPWMHSHVLNDVMRRAEEEIIRRVDAVLPAYGIIKVQLAEDWATWLGEKDATPDEVKACRRTVEGVKWTMTREEKAASKKHRLRPTVSDPSGLL